MRNNKKRAGAFWGIHVDFHANIFEKDIGSFTKAENIGKYLDEIKPDYLQIDTKGHPGYASYFSEYGEVAPGVTHDHLKIIREETEKRGIALIAHYSSIWDEASCKNNHDWAIVDKNGEASKTNIDFNSDYTDKKFIPMVKELCGKYGFDGIWIDGDSWALRENYSPETIEKFLKNSNFDFIDKDNLKSESHFAFRQFTTNEFYEFLKYYCREIKKDYPDFEICSNTSFTCRQPIKPFDNFDFLSADMYDLSFRTTARNYASHDKEWDLMGWGHPSRFVTKVSEFNELYGGRRLYRCINHVDRDLRMAATAISLGGGFQIIGLMSDKGEILMYDIPRMKEVAKFLNERKEFNYNSKPLPNAAIWWSQENLERDYEDEVLFQCKELQKGLCDLVIDAGFPVDVVFDYHIDENNIQKHNVIIVPETKYISLEKKKKLLEYVYNGGNLIITGVNSCMVFEDVIDADIKKDTGIGIYAEIPSKPEYFIGATPAVLFENYNGEEFAHCFADKLDKDYNPVKATAITSYGKGKIAFIGWDIINEYFENKLFGLPYIMKEVLIAVDKKPNAYLKSGPSRVEIIPAEKDEKLIVNVINTNEYYYFDLNTAYGEIPPLYEIEIAVKCKSEPKSIMLEPEHQAAQYSFDGEYAYVTIDKLHIHTIIVIEF
ncbi:MAG: alpha-L-fucosidase [Lachnospiraceae bacterium]|nr:alpha-L-fucosidase [Lachnospiraceae bacterium]